MVNKLMLNTYFDKVFYINLDRRTDRKEECEKELQSHNIIAERVSAVDANTLTDMKLYPQKSFNRSCYGLVLTNIKIFENAKKNNYKSIVIFEDDVVLSENFNTQLYNIYPQVPNNWDILYLGAHHIKPPIKISNNVGKCVWALTTHAIIFKQSSYDIILNELYKLDYPIDWTLYTLYDKLNVYSIIPSIAFQRPSYSDIEHDFTDYTRLIK